MIQVQDIELHFGDRTILDGINFSLGKGEKVGLTGKNGAGKTSLFKVINGDILPDGGDVILPKGYEIGFLSQHLEEMEDIPVKQEAGKALSSLHAIEEQLNKLQTQLAERTDYTSAAYMEIVHKLDELSNQYAMRGGHKAESNIEKILKGLGFTDETMEHKVSTFSGGWKMRILLAKILLREPDLLLLDEPTNHLDLNSILWLEDWLKQSSAMLILISHDVQFLDNVTSRTLEVENGKLYDYPVSYTQYKIQRAERRAQLLAAYKNQQKKIEHKEKLIDRFRAKATKASMAQSLIKQLDKIDRIELDEEDSSSMKLRFQDAPRTGRIVAEVKALSKSYGDNHVLQNVDLRIERGEKIAFVGQNGQGKTTLAKLILGQLQADNGSVQLGHNVSVGYYAQDQSAHFNPDHTVLETIENIAPREWYPKLRSLLGTLLFSGEEVDKKVSVLSGGEKARLAIAELLMFPYNFLLLDEPTNHLDVQSKEILKEALDSYDGTLLVLSHDREFLDGLVDRTVEFRNHKLLNHIGSFSDFMKKRKTENMRDIEFSSASANAVKSPQSPRLSSKELYHKRKDVQRKINKVEKRIDNYETEVGQLEIEMGDPDFFKRDDADKLAQKHGKLKADIAKATEEWERYVEELENIEN